MLKRVTASLLSGSRVFLYSDQMRTIVDALKYHIPVRIRAVPIENNMGDACVFELEIEGLMLMISDEIKKKKRQKAGVGDQRNFFSVRISGKQRFDQRARAAERRGFIVKGIADDHR